MFMSDREAIIKITRVPQNDGSLLYLTQTIDYPGKPYSDKCVRMSLAKGTKVYQQGNDLICEEFSHFDMGGYFPMGLLRMVAGSLISK